MMKPVLKALWCATIATASTLAAAQYDDSGQPNYPERASPQGEMVPSMEQPYRQPTDDSRGRGPQGPMRTDEVSGKAYLDCQDSIKCQQRNPGWPDQPWWKMPGPQNLNQRGDFQME